MKTFERQRNWRWQLIDELVGASKRLPSQFRDDPLFCEAFNFWNTFQKCLASDTPTVDLMRLEGQYPEVAAAYGIYSSPGVERYFIEALVMANEEPQTIAVESGYHVRIIKAYEHLFFDVRTKLDQRLYVMGNILGPMFMHGTSAGDYDHLWKAIGYFCGSDTLTALWKVGKLNETDATALTDILKSRLLTQATVASFSRKPNSYNAGEIIDSYVSNASHELAKEGAAPEIPQDDGNNYLAQIKGAVLDYMQLTLRSHLSQHGSVEKCLSGEDVSVNESEYHRPFELVGQQ